MPKPWRAVADSSEYQALAPEKQARAQQQYFREVVEPQIPQEKRRAAWTQFRREAGRGDFLRTARAGGLDTGEVRPYDVPAPMRPVQALPQTIARAPEDDRPDETPHPSRDIRRAAFGQPQEDPEVMAGDGEANLLGVAGRTIKQAAQGTKYLGEQAAATPGPMIAGLADFPANLALAAIPGSDPNTIFALGMEAALTKPGLTIGERLSRAGSAVLDIFKAEPVSRAARQVAPGAMAYVNKGAQQYADETRSLLRQTSEKQARDLEELGFSGEVASAVAQMAPAAVLMFATKSPKLAASTIAGPVAAQSLSEGLDRGQTIGQAAQRAAAMTAAEFLTEWPALGVIFAPIKAIQKTGGLGEASKILGKRLASSAGAEYGQEYITSLIQNAYDAGVLDDQKSIGQILQEAGHDAALGAIVGGVYGLPGATAEARAGYRDRHARAKDALRAAGVNNNASDLVAREAAQRAGDAPLTPELIVQAVDEVSDAELQSSSARYKKLRERVSEKQAKTLMRDEITSAVQLQIGGEERAGTRPARSGDSTNPDTRGQTGRSLAPGVFDAVPELTLRSDAAPPPAPPGNVIEAPEPDADIAAAFERFKDDDRNEGSTETVASRAGSAGADRAGSGGDRADDGLGLQKALQPGAVAEAATPGLGEAAVVRGEAREPALPLDDAAARAQERKLDETRARVERSRQSEPADALTDSYRKKAAAEFGNADYFNADLAKELFPEYSASIKARRDQSDVVQERAAAVRDAAFERRIAAPSSTGEVVTFMAGGTGSGKSTATPRTGIVYDTTLANADSAIRKIDRVLASGRKVQVNYVFTDPLVALERSIRRSAEIGRGVPLKTHHDTHAGANQTVRRIAEHYKSDRRVRVQAWDSGPVTLKSSGAPEFDYNGTQEKLNEILDAALASETIDQATYRAFGGTLPGRDGQGGGRSVPEVRPDLRSLAQESGAPEAQGVLGSASVLSDPRSGRSAPRVSASEPSPEAAPGRKPRTTPIDDARLRAPEIRRDLEAMAPEAGWDEVGGRLMRSPEYEGDPNPPVTGRTPWVPRAPWFAAVQRDAGLPGNLRGQATREAVRKALAGDRMSEPEKRHIKAIMDWAEMERRDYAAQGADDIDPFDLAGVAAENGTNSLTLVEEALAARAREIDEDAFEHAAVQYGDDDRAFMAAIRSIVHGRTTEAVDGQSAGRAVGSGGAGVQRAQAEAEGAGQPAVPGQAQGEVGREVGEPEAVSSAAAESSPEAGKYSDLSGIQVERPAIEKDTGRTVTVTERADEALADVDRQIETFEGLLKCLAS